MNESELPTMTDENVRQSEVSGAAAAEAHQQLITLLSGNTVAELRGIARARGFTVKGTLKDAIVAQVADFLSNPVTIRSALAGLDPALHMALAAVYCLATPEMGVTIAELNQVLTRLAPAHVPRADSAMRLYSLGLVSKTTDPYNGVQRFIVPAAVVPYLPPWSEALPAPGRTDGLPHVQQADDGLVWPSLLYVVWQQLRSTRARLRPARSKTSVERTTPAIGNWPVDPAELEVIQRKSGWWYLGTDLSVPAFQPELDDTTLRELGTAAGGAERAELVYHLLRALNAIRVERDAIEARQPAILDFLRLGTVDQIRTVFRTWLHLNAWSELNLVLRGSDRIRLRRRVGYTQFSVKNLFDELAQARRFVVRVVSCAAPGEWVAVDRLLHAVWALNPDFLQARRPYPLADPMWWLDRGASGQVFKLEDEADWRQGPGQFVTRLLTGPLAWLGVVELGYDDQAPVAFRMTPLGALLLGRPSSFAVVTTGPPLEVSDNMEITVLTGHGDRSIHDMLSRTGELAAADARGFRYRLTRHQLHTAFEGGLVLDDFLRWLEDHTAGRLPGGVAAQLTRWWESYGRVRLYPDLTLIEFADDYTLPELLAVTRLRQFVVHVISPRAVVIKAEDVESIMSELVARGYTPKLQGGAA